MKKQPGAFLIVMILFLIIGDAQIPYYLANPNALYSVYRTIPSWYPIYAAIGLASNIAIIIGMWQMKKWAIYLLAIYFISKIVVDTVYIIPGKWATVFVTTIAGAGFWAWAIYRKRAQFD